MHEQNIPRAKQKEGLSLITIVEWAGKNENLSVKYNSNRIIMRARPQNGYVLTKVDKNAHSIIDAQC